MNGVLYSFLPFFALLLLGPVLLLPAFGLAGCTMEGNKMDNPAPKTQAALSGQESGAPGGLKGGGSHDPMVNQAGQVMVYIRLSDLSFDNLNELMTRGAVLTHIAEAYKTVTAFVSPDRLESIRGIPGVLNVQEATKPQTNRPALGKEKSE